MLSTLTLRFSYVLMLAFAPGLAFACDAASSTDEAEGGQANQTGSGGSTSSHGGSSTASGGATYTVGGGNFGTPTQAGSGNTSDRYFKTDVTRNGTNYRLIANGWGPKFQSQSLSFSGTSFTVTSMQGSQGDKYEPAAYPAVFCGAYSDSVSRECGLPKAVSAITSLKTGWRWKPNGNSGQYNAAYDIWLGNSTNVGSLSAYLMVWLRDPPGQQPAGKVVATNVAVPNTPGTWRLWTGQVNNVPYIAYTRLEGSDTYELEFDVVDFLHEAASRSVQVPGSNILSVAVGFEIWNGPITNLESQDFYVKVN